VVLMVVGHTHRNVVLPHVRGSFTRLGNRILGDGGFWEVSTASHIDWPVQSRLLEIAAGDGIVSIFTTMLDLSSAPDSGGDLSNPTSLASLARELAYNDPTEKAKHGVADTDRHGDLDDRNTQLLVPAPFTINAPQLWGSSVALGRNADGRLELFGTDSGNQVWHRAQVTPDTDSWFDWALFGGLMRSIAVDADLDGRLEVFGVNSVGEVWHRWQITGGWSAWTSLGNVNARSIAVARDSSGRLVVFVTTVDGDIMHFRQTVANATTWLSWSSFGGAVTDPALPFTLFRKVAAETNADGRVQVLAITDYGALYSRTLIATGAWTWTDWTSIPARVPLTAVAMSRNNDGRLQFHVVDSDRRVFESSQTSVGAPTWRTWIALDGGQTRMTQVTARLNSPGRIEVFGVDNTGRVWRRQQTAVNSRNYTTWTDFAGTLRPDVPAVVVPLQARASTPITAVARGSDRVDAFAVAGDGRTMTNWMNATAGWTGWVHLSGGVASTGGAGSPVTSVHRTGQRVDVFTVDNGDHHVWSAFSNTSTDWSNWFQIGTLSCRPGSTVTAVSRNANQLDLFTTASDGRIMSISWSAAGGWAADWFQVFGGIAAPGSTVTAISRNANHLDLFMVGTDNYIYSTYWDVATGWSSWFRLRSWQARSDATVTAVARHQNQIDLFTTGLDNRIISISWTDPGGWAAEWFTIGNAFAASPSTVTALARSSTHLDLFIVDQSSHQVSTAVWDIATGWSSWRSLSAVAVNGSHVGAVSRSPDHMDLLFVDFNVQTMQWDSASGWTPPFRVVGD
jgi:hypothetical protein